MSSAHVDCALVSSLIGAWRDGQLSDADSESFEEHLLVCPPCMDLNENLQRALGALRQHVDLTPPQELVEGMLAYARELEGA